MDCPFCGMSGYDKPTLAYHLLSIDCKDFDRALKEFTAGPLTDG